MGSKVIRNITKVFRSASGVLFGRSTSGTGRGEEIAFASIPALIGVYTTAQVDSIIGGIEGLTSADIDTLAEINAILTDADLASVSYVDSGLSGKQTTLVSGTNIKTVNSTSLLGSGDITVGLSGTGSVDNAALRADGTGGATLQNSAWIITDNYTASPNNTVNHGSLQATGGTTNVSASIVPKAAGAFMLAVPDGTATGGNVRGSNAVDLQISRSAATEVASGSLSFAFGYRNTVSGTDGATAIGGLNTVSGRYATTLGRGNTISSESCWIVGESCTASNFASYSFIAGYVSTANNSFYSNVFGLFCSTTNSEIGLASGYYAASTRYGQESRANGRFSATGDAQKVGFLARNVTTSAVATELYLNGSSTRLTIPSGKVMSALVRVVGVKSDGSEVIKFLRDVTIKNVGGTTSLEAAIDTIGTDINVSGATLDLDADNTNDTLKIAVTPPTGTWRWFSVVDVAAEIAYGT